MSGDFQTIQLAFLTALGVARFWTQREQPDGVEPGDFAARNDNDGAAIRAHNSDWSYRWSPCWTPSHEGIEL